MSLPESNDNPNPRGLLQRWFGDDAVGMLGRGAVVTLVVNVVAAVVGLLLHIVLTWSLESETQYGLYLLAVTTINLLVLPIVAGWDTVLTRFLGQSAKPADEPQSKELLRTSTRRVLCHAVISMLLLGGGLICLKQLGWPALIQKTSPSTLVLIVLVLPLLALSILRQGTLRGLHRPAVSLIPETILTPAVVMTATLLLIAFGMAATGATAILAYTLAVGLAFAAGTLLLPPSLRRASLLGSRRSSDVPTVEAPRHHVTMREWISLAGSALVVSLSFTIISRIDEWLLAVLESPAAAGLYGPASRYATFVIFGLSAVNPIFGPLVARHQHDRDELQRLAKRAARMAAIASTPLALLFMAAPWVPLSLHPEPYLQTMCVLRVLAAAQWLNTLFGNAGMLLSMTGHHRDLAIVLVLTALLDIGLNLALIPIFGYLGAAIATGTSIVTWNVAAWILVKWRLGISAGAL